MNLRDQLQRSLGGTYTLDRELGGGGMSRVFVAEETRLGRTVVVKVLSTELAAGLSAERFEREIRVAASLQQANIVPVLAAGDTDGVPYYTMPFVEGESLRARLRERGALPVSEVMSILRDVARALAYAHDRGIVHRDIKPDNVLLSGGAAVVTDFGIAKAISAARTDSGSATLTQLGTAIGTPAYISPEQAAGDPAVDHRADIYSFGCMAYELLAGHPPFTNRPPQRLMAAHMTEAPQPVRDVRADAPPGLAALVMRCLEKEPSTRPQSGSEILGCLDAIVTSDPSRPAMPAVLLGGPRMLWKALAMYTAAVIVVAALAQAAIVGIGLPNWVLPGALIVMALGLPVILFTAYAQRVMRRAMTRSSAFTPGGTPSLPPNGTIATLAIKASPHLSWRRTGFGGVAAVGAFVALVGLFMLLRALGIGPAGSLLAAGKMTAHASVVIDDFTTANTDSELGPVVSDAVRAALTQSSVVSVLSHTQVARQLQYMRRPANTHLDVSTAREVAQREAAQAVVDGNVTGVAGGYILTLRLVTADSGAELASFRATGVGPQGIIDAADKVSRQLREKIGESLRTVQASPPLSNVTTSSLDALRAYSEAGRATDIPVEIALYRRAVSLDSTFGGAWMNLATDLFNTGAPQSSIDSALDHGFALKDQLSERERLSLLAVYYEMGSHRDRSRSADVFAQEAREFRSTSALVNMGEMLRSMRQYVPAESLNREASHLRNNGDAFVPWVNIAELQMDRGHADSAQATLAEALRRFPGNAFLAADAAVAAYALNDLAGARRALDSLAQTNEGGAQAIEVPRRVSLALVGGQVGRAGAVMQRGTGDDRTALLDSLTLVTARTWFRGTNAGAAEAIDAALKRYPLGAIPLQDRPYFEAATAYARIGRADRARALLAAYRAAVADTALRRVQAADLHNALGELALAEHHPDRALAEFRQGDIGYDGKPATECAPCLPLELARAYDAAGQADSAIAAYEAFLSTPFYNRLVATDGLSLALAHERLGELYEARGDRARALAHYEAFATLWKYADPELQPRVADVKRRIALLGSSEPAGSQRR